MGHFPLSPVWVRHDAIHYSYILSELQVAAKKRTSAFFRIPLYSCHPLLLHLVTPCEVILWGVQETADH